MKLHGICPLKVVFSRQFVHMKKLRGKVAACFASSECKLLPARGCRASWPGPTPRGTRAAGRRCGRCCPCCCGTSGGARWLCRSTAVKFRAVFLSNSIGISYIRGTAYIVDIWDKSQNSHVSFLFRTAKACRSETIFKKVSYKLLPTLELICQKIFFLDVGKCKMNR